MTLKQWDWHKHVHTQQSRATKGLLFSQSSHRCYRDQTLIFNQTRQIHLSHASIGSQSSNKHSGCSGWGLKKSIKSYYLWLSTSTFFTCVYDECCGLWISECCRYFLCLMFQTFFQCQEHFFFQVTLKVSSCFFLQSSARCWCFYCTWPPSLK